jgi:hypothetical protein
LFEALCLNVSAIVYLVNVWSVNLVPFIPSQGGQFAARS